ncbi:hypothetical protein T05_10069 [Trichinella murrelli]|uniref:Uncharacterized protein n=1 Tax=Trichinella murrelli TaxID=144512 RepID=A0A0V0TM14_9BILA|nr:hypothetical protein T05_10069 [Trichinella murrelli]
MRSEVFRQLDIFIMFYGFNEQLKFNWFYDYCKREQTAGCVTQQMHPSKYQKKRILKEDDLEGEREREEELRQKLNLFRDQIEICCDDWTSITVRQGKQQKPTRLDPPRPDVPLTHQGHQKSWCVRLFFFYFFFFFFASNRDKNLLKLQHGQSTMLIYGLTIFYLPIFIIFLSPVHPFSSSDWMKLMRKYDQSVPYIRDPVQQQDNRVLRLERKNVQYYANDKRLGFPAYLARVFHKTNSFSGAIPIVQDFTVNR